MKLIVTVREIFNKGLWDEFCKSTKINSWCVNEGQMDMDEEVEVPKELISKFLN